jgi:pimeloyl-ACP methyl ester carboxylesterase
MEGTGLLFQPLLGELPSRIQPAVVSYPNSDPRGYAELLPIVLDAVPKDGPFVLLGESFSGPLALFAAASRPPGLAGVILAVSFVQNPLPYLPALARFLARPKLFRLVPLLVELRGEAARGSNPALQRLVLRANRQPRPEVWAARANAILSVRAERALLDCAAPILYLRGESDLVVPARNSRRIRALRPDVEIVSLPGPHLLLQNNPARSAQAIASFVERVCPSRES